MLDRVPGKNLYIGGYVRGLRLVGLTRVAISPSPITADSSQHLHSETKGSSEGG